MLPQIYHKKSENKYEFNNISYLKSYFDSLKQKMSTSKHSKKTFEMSAKRFGIFVKVYTSKIGVSTS